MQKFWKTNEYFYLIIILLIAAFFRFYGINWDQNQHLHPDERFLTMVTQSLKWPSSLPEYFNTSISPFNPHNSNFPFYVYGTFPIFFVKALSEISGFTDYNTITILGRFISGCFDILVVYLVFLIGKKVFSTPIGLLAAFFYSISILPIQLSHFFAVDTFLNFFMVLTTYLLLKSIYTPRKIWFTFMGISFGLAFASKISAFLLAPPILLVFLYLIYKFKHHAFFWGLSFLTISFLIFRIFQPYAFLGPSFFDITPNPKFLANLQEIRTLFRPGNFYPPAIQWTNTTPLLHPLKDIILWGLGLPLGILSISGFILVILNLPKNFKHQFKTNLLSKISILILLTALLTTFLYQGTQFLKLMRYFIPIYPYLAIFSAYFLFQNFPKSLAKLYNPMFAIITILILSWPLSFISIYSKPHSRVLASNWIYENIPVGSKIAFEHWDDALPLNLKNYNSSNYEFIELPLFEPDSVEKWNNINTKLSQVDYIILSSNRLYASISRVPEKYPITSKYYRDLFNEDLNFKFVTQFSSRPNLPIPFINTCITPTFADFGKIAERFYYCSDQGLTIIDDFADESFTVYDHPKVLIFKNNVK